MKKRIKVLFLLFILLIPKVVLADDDTSCSKVIQTLDDYNIAVSKLSSLDCKNAISSDIIKECNNNSINRSYSLSRLFQYSDNKPECITSEIENVLKENQDTCNSVFDSSLKKITNKYLRIFYILAPFLLIIFGSVDLFKILAMTSIEMANKAKKDLMKRIIAFVLLYLTPVIVNFIISFNQSDYGLKGNTYVCKNNVYYEKGHLQYVGLAQVSQRFLSNINIDALTGEAGSMTVNSTGVQAILESAQKVMDMIRSKNGCYFGACDNYCCYKGPWHGGNIKASTYEQSGTSCATYVSSVLYVSGVLTEDRINKYSYNFANDTPGEPAVEGMLRDAGWKEIRNYSDLQPGDIAFIDNDYDPGIDHVQIYAGDDLWYNAGTNRGIYESPTYAWLSHWKLIVAYRIP